MLSLSPRVLVDTEHMLNSFADTHARLHVLCACNKKNLTAVYFPAHWPTAQSVYAFAPSHTHTHTHTQKFTHTHTLYKQAGG